MADGAVHIDTTPYTLDEVIDLVVALVGAGPERRVSTVTAHRAAAQRRAGTRPRYLLHPLRPIARAG